MNNALHTDTRTDSPLRDSSGFRYFSAGELGSAHAMAHQMLDAGELALGHARLEAFLDGRSGHGSKWVHVQWHMLVFELAVAEIESARARFYREILPAAAGTRDALTDAPAALWRIALASPHAQELPWNVVAASARDALYESDDHYVTLHNLLALAGAGELATIDGWLESWSAESDDERTLERMALGLRCFASGDYSLAARAFAAALPEVGRLGGSRAQNELFVAIYRRAVARAAPAAGSSAVH